MKETNGRNHNKLKLWRNQVHIFSNTQRASVAWYARRAPVEWNQKVSNSQWYCFENYIKCYIKRFWDTWTPKMFFLIIKTDILLGNLINISAQTATLVTTLSYNIARFPHLVQTWRLRLRFKPKLFQYPALLLFVVRTTLSTCIWLTKQNHLEINCINYCQVYSKWGVKKLCSADKMSANGIYVSWGQVRALTHGIYLVDTFLFRCDYNPVSTTLTHALQEELSHLCAQQCFCFQN